MLEVAHRFARVSAFIEFAKRTHVDEVHLFLNLPG
jgi:hypothetical protein